MTQRSGGSNNRSMPTASRIVVITLRRDEWETLSIAIADTPCNNRRASCPSLFAHPD